LGGGGGDGGIGGALGGILGGGGGGAKKSGGLLGGLFVGNTKPLCHMCVCASSTVCASVPPRLCAYASVPILSSSLSLSQCCTVTGLDPAGKQLNQLAMAALARHKKVAQQQLLEQVLQCCSCAVHPCHSHAALLHQTARLLCYIHLVISPVCYDSHVN
jgi:hypothetical protein